MEQPTDWKSFNHSQIINVQLLHKSLTFNLTTNMQMR